MRQLARMRIRICYVVAAPTKCVLRILARSERRRELLASSDAQLAVHVGQVGVDCPRREMKAVCDLAAAHARLCEQRDFTLAVGQGLDAPPTRHRGRADSASALGELR